MATQYPTEHEDFQREIERLAKISQEVVQMRNKLMALEIRNKEMVVELMRKSAQLSEAEETLKRWRTELEIVAEQKGHNLCWMWIPRLLKATLGHTGKYPDPENVTREEFAQGCLAYQDDIFCKDNHHV